MEIVASGASFDFDHCYSRRGQARLSLDLARLPYTTLYGLVCMSCCVLQAAQDGLAVQFKAPADASVCNFVSRLGFDRFLTDNLGFRCELPVSAGGTSENVVIDLRRLGDANDLSPLEALLFDRLRGHGPSQVVTAICEALWELGGNALEHAHGPGLLAAVVQRPDRSGQQVQFAIGDIGIGIRRSFDSPGSTRHPQTDHEAIDLAVEDLVSSSADPGRGQGLPTTIESVSGLGGRVMIRTGGALQLVSGERREKKQPLARVVSRRSVPYLGGTVVSVSIPCG